MTEREKAPVPARSGLCETRRHRFIEVQRVVGVDDVTRRLRGRANGDESLGYVGIEEQASKGHEQQVGNVEQGRGSGRDQLSSWNRSEDCWKSFVDVRKASRCFSASSVYWSVQRNFMDSANTPFIGAVGIDAAYCYPLTIPYVRMSGIGTALR